MRRQHIIPRADVKGQDRLFIFFSLQGLVGTLAGVGIGYPFFAIINAMGNNFAGLIVLACMGGLGFVIGQCKIPDTNAFPIFKKIGGEYIRDIIVRWLKFRKNKKKFVNHISVHQDFEVKEDKINDIIMNKN